MPRLSLPASLLAGGLLGLVALQQLKWLRDQGAWVEGKGRGLRIALALLDKKAANDEMSLALEVVPRQAMGLVDGQGHILESNGLFTFEVGLPRHELRGYALDALFQGEDQPAWQGLREQLLQHGCASLQATQVKADGTFRPVVLEATAFDRGMALVWITDPVAGTLALRHGPGALAPGGEEDSRRQTVNALLAISGAIDLAHTGEGAPAGLAQQLSAALERLSPQVEAPASKPAESQRLLDSFRPSLVQVVSSGEQVQVDAASMDLRVPAGTLLRITTHLLLHARESHPKASFLVRLESVDLGGRPFGRLTVRALEVPEAWPRAVFGLGWLRQAVQEASGLLELDRKPGGGVEPRVYFPSSAFEAVANRQALQHRRIWLVDQDPLARQAMVSMIGQVGGTATGFEDLSGLLKTSREQAQPDVLVLERTPRLDRFQKALRAFQKEAIPTLVVGMGQPLPLDPASLGLNRLGFLEKPFSQAAFQDALLALLLPSGASPRSD